MRELTDYDKRLIAIKKRTTDVLVSQAGSRLSNSMFCDGGFSIEDEFKKHALEDMVWLIQKHDNLAQQSRALTSKVDWYRDKYE